MNLKSTRPEDRLVYNIICIIKSEYFRKKKCKKAKWLSEEALQTAEKRREA